MSLDFNCNCNFSSSVRLNFLDFSTSLSRTEKYVFLLLFFWIDSVPYCFMHSLNCWVDPIEFMSRHTTLYTFWSFIWILVHGLYAARSLFVYLYYITPQKRNGRNCVLKFFHRDWRRCTMSYPRMVKSIILGMWTYPLDLNTLGLHTSSFCFSIDALYRINLERLLFVLLRFLFCETTTLSFIYEYGTENMGWNILHAFIVEWLGLNRVRIKLILTQMMSSSCICNSCEFYVQLRNLSCTYVQSMCNWKKVDT